MAKGLTRDPQDWALDWGWVSPLRARRAMQQLEGLAADIEGAFDPDDEGALAWARSARSVAKYLDPDRQIRARANTPRKRALREWAELP